jgi:hypothetical protein
MIDKSGEYWHLYFNESCDDKPAEILALIEKLFAEIAQMGDVHYLRFTPQITRDCPFDEEPRANVFCRFSSNLPKGQPHTDEPLGLT